MQPCNSCQSCSFPERVAQAKGAIPTSWAAELIAEEAPDHIWLAASNLHDHILENDGVPPDSFINMISGGEITDEDVAWAEASLASCLDR